MRSTLLTLTFAALAAAPLAAAPGGDNWYADFDEALAAAKEQQKDLLVDFTGSDWCGWCKRLDAEVFSHDAFLEGVADEFILVALDFPNAPEIKAKVPNPERNAELRDLWGIRGYPTILLVDTDSNPFAQTGYRQGGPEAYLTHLGEIAESGRKTGKELAELASSIEKAEGEARDALLERAIDLLAQQSGSSPFTGRLTAFAKQAIDSPALATRAVGALLKAGVVDADVEAAVERLDPKNQEGLREQVVMARMGSLRSIDDVGAWTDSAIALVDDFGVRSTDVARELYTNVAYMCNRYLERPEDAKRFANLALEVGGIEDEGTLEMLRQIVGVDEQSS
jgi:thioredoxin-related protein